jgi:hypothetical protein
MSVVQGMGGITNAHSILQSIQAMAMAQAAKVDRKLYIGNLPSGITPQTVFLHFFSNIWILFLFLAC